MRHQLADTVKVVTKLVCKFKSCHTPSPHTPLLHFREISSETRECDIFDLSGRIMRPPLLKTRSIGELDAGTLRARIYG